MFTVRLATAPDPNPMPGALYVVLEGLTASPVSLMMPPPGTAINAPPIQVASPAPTAFSMTIGYHLDNRRVGVVVNGVIDGDAINIFAARHQDPGLPSPGVLYVGNIVHGNLQATSHDCSVQCENSTPVVDECCIICRDGNLITETCC